MDYEAWITMVTETVAQYIRSARILTEGATPGAFAWWKDSTHIDEPEGIALPESWGGGKIMLTGTQERMDHITLFWEQFDKIPFGPMIKDDIRYRLHHDHGI